jgi:hypothetical protein
MAKLLFPSILSVAGLSHAALFGRPDAEQANRRLRKSDRASKLPVMRFRRFRRENAGKELVTVSVILNSPHDMLSENGERLRRSYD